MNEASQCTPYGNRPLGDMGRWWTNCQNCGAGITITAEDTRTLPDPEDWYRSGSIKCPICDGRTGGWNGDPR